MAEIGISPDNWAQDDFSFVTSLSMMALDTVLYAALGLYLERVLPSKVRNLPPSTPFASLVIAISDSTSSVCSPPR